MPDRVFRHRRDAGRALARLLERYGDRGDVLVLGLPRGGVPVEFEVATALGAPLDVFLVRKVGVPGHEEPAMGAIASGGVAVVNDDICAGPGDTARGCPAHRRAGEPGDAWRAGEDRRVGAQLARERQPRDGAREHR